LAQQAQLRKQLEEANRAHEADIAACERQYPDKNRKPATPRVKCFGEANVRQATQTRNPDADLVRAMSAEMLVIAEQYDSGRLSEAQYEAAKAKTFSEYTSRAMQRQDNAAMASAAQQQAAAATVQAYGANRPRTCNTWGNTVTCY
jgi:hypothetical protein